MRNRGRFVISAIIMGLMMLFLIGTGVAAIAKGGAVPLDSAQKGEVCEFTAVYAFKAFEVENSVNFIPTGKERYYLMYTEDDAVRYLVRAKPSWIKKRFDENGLAVGLGQKIKGLVAAFDYEIKDDVRELNEALVLENIGSLSTSYYIDARYKEFGVLRILSGIGFVVVVVFLRLAAISGIFRGNKFLKAIFGVVSLGVSLLLIYTLSVGGFGV